MKKFIPLMLACVLFSCVTAACRTNGDTSSGSASHREEIPSYTTAETLMLGMWLGVPGTLPVFDENENWVNDGQPIPDDKFREYYCDIKEAGFTVADVGYYGVNYQSNLRALKMAEEMGLKQLIYDPGLLAVLASTDKTEERIIREIKVNYAEYLSSSAFAGIRVCDEPSYDDIPKYEKMCDLWNQIAPDTIFYINLLPVVANKAAVTENYKNYIKQYTDHIDTNYVSYDHYVLKSNGSSNYIDRSFLFNLTQVKLAAPERDCWTIVQSIRYGGTNRALTSAADCGFQAYSALACGYKGISWFCFWSPSPFDGATTFGTGAYDRKGNKTPTYDYIKQTQLELKAFENVYLNFEWRGIIGNIGEENDNAGENDEFAVCAESAVSSERIKSVLSRQDTLIGVFKDKENRDGYMAVNYTEPSAGLENEVRFVFNDCSRAIVISDGVQEVVEAIDGAIEFKQKAGDGTFVIPLK